MKQFIVALFIAALFSSVHAAETSSENSAPSSDTEVQKPKGEETISEAEKPVSPVSETAAVEPTPTSKEETKITEEKLVPAEGAPVAVAGSAMENAVAPLAVSTAPVSALTEAPKGTETKAVETAKAPPVGCVASLVQIVSFHEKEIANLNQMIARWEAKVNVTTNRRRELDQDLKAKLQKLEELLTLNTKVSKKEASGVQKDIRKLNKDIESTEKELKNERKELTAEIRTLSQASSQALKDTCQQAISDVQTP
ncbi:MAG: hypothetical protein IPN90_05330 [Elusimicrobia bacterium]|nr:hypothetical protein [Elusimicrobiota bacterium]